MGDADQLFTSTLERFTDQICAIDGNERYSYGELLRFGTAIATELPATRSLVFISGSNSIHTIAAYVGALRAGHAVHLLDPQKPAANHRLVEAYAPEAIITCSDRGFRIEHSDLEPGPLHPDVAILLATSGSTGSSKFVKLSYANIQANTESIVEYLGLTGRDRSITSLKPFYSYGLSVLNTHLAVGGSLVLTDGSVQDAEFWRLMQSSSVTNLAGVPYTYELLDALAPDWSAVPELRFMTQAGGRLDPHLVRTFATAGDHFGWDFYVMYGQTEGSPRLSYLPPRLAAENPDSIGVAVPGGSLCIVDEDGREVTSPGTEGELTYHGPNVMIGYAHQRSDLSHRDEIACLHTGDLATCDEQGLFRITGRKSRFVKPFGVRVSLDDIERRVGQSYGACAATGDDDQIVIAFEGKLTDEVDMPRRLATDYRLPVEVFAARRVSDLPRLSNGKIDYQTLASLAKVDAGAQQSVARGFTRRFLGELADILLGRSAHIASVTDAFRPSFEASDISPDDTFSSLAGDSLSFVQTAVRLENYLGHLPQAWHEMTIAELESLSRGVDV